MSRDKRDMTNAEGWMSVIGFVVGFGGILIISVFDLDIYSFPGLIVGLITGGAIFLTYPFWLWIFRKIR